MDGNSFGPASHAAVAGAGGEADARRALQRFGLGRALGEPLPVDPRGWLLAQLSQQATPPAIAVLPTQDELMRQALDQREAIQRAPDAASRQEAQAAQRRTGFGHYRDAVQARMLAALQAEAPFHERLVHFWANHFSVSADNVAMVPFVGRFEFDAIRPHVMGRFEELLVAVETHPAMLVFLNQSTSIGPDSRMAKAGRARAGLRQPGLNENLAREILELHTLGVRSGYTQSDVAEFALALTGWSLEGDTFMRGGFSGGFLFRDNAHQPGARTILGKRYSQAGQAQVLAVLHDLARAPATARFIAGKLARHFAGEQPPPQLQARLAQAFMDSEGDLPTVYRVMIESPEVWQGPASLFKSPWDWTVSALRGLGVMQADQIRRLQLPQLLDQLGQPVWRPGSPAGWPDLSAAWAAPDALVRRVEAAHQMAQRIGAGLDPRALSVLLLGDAGAVRSRQIIEGADSQRTALALTLLAPEFMRR